MYDVSGCVWRWREAARGHRRRLGSGLNNRMSSRYVRLSACKLPPSGSVLVAGVTGFWRTAVASCRVHPTTPHESLPSGCEAQQWDEGTITSASGQVCRTDSVSGATWLGRVERHLPAGRVHAGLTQLASLTPPDATLPHPYLLLPHTTSL